MHVVRVWRPAGWRTGTYPVKKHIVFSRCFFHGGVFFTVFERCGSGVQRVGGQSVLLLELDIVRGDTLLLVEFPSSRRHPPPQGGLGGAARLKNFFPPGRSWWCSEIECLFNRRVSRVSVDEDLVPCYGAGR